MGTKNGTEQKAYNAAKDLAILTLLSLLALLAGLTTAALLTSCSTMSGLGQDITAVSDSLARSAVDRK